MILIIREIRSEMLGDEAFRIYSSCMYHPTPEKYAAVIPEYLSDKAVRFLGAYRNDILLGILAVRDGEILGIAVHKNVRSRGVGRELIHHALNIFHTLTAETDDDAIGFYRACGFSCESFDRPFPNGIVRRYRCTLKK